MWLCRIQAPLLVNNMHSRSAFWLDTRWQWKRTPVPTVVSEMQKERERRGRGCFLQKAQNFKGRKGTVFLRGMQWFWVLRTKCTLSGSWIIGEVSGGWPASASTDLKSVEWHPLSTMAVQTGRLPMRCRGCSVSAYACFGIKVTSLLCRMTQHIRVQMSLGLLKGWLLNLYSFE